PRSIAPVTVTLNVEFRSRDAAGVNTACAGAAMTVVPATEPDGPLTAISVPRFVLAASGSLKLTVMVEFPGTCTALFAGMVETMCGGPVENVDVDGCTGCRPSASVTSVVTVTVIWSDAGNPVNVATLPSDDRLPFMVKLPCCAPLNWIPAVD